MGEGEQTPPFNVRIRAVWEDILNCICIVYTLGCDMKGLPIADYKQWSLKATH